MFDFPFIALLLGQSFNGFDLVWFLFKWSKLWLHEEGMLS